MNDAKPASGDGLLADLELVWNSISDDKHTNAAYQRLRAALATTEQPGSSVQGEVVAWLTDDGRVISGRQKEAAIRDGGASASSVKPYSIPCYTTPPPAPAADNIADAGKKAPPEARGVEGEPRAILQWIMREAEAMKEPCGSDPESSAAIRNGRLASIAQAAAQALGIVRGPSYATPNPVRAEQQECGAIGSQGCTYRPEGPHGEMQCTYCGAEQPEGKGAYTLPPDTGPFADWLAREMPAGTVIGNPHWWAPRILRQIAMLAAAPAAPGVRVDEAMVKRALGAWFEDASCDGLTRGDARVEGWFRRMRAALAAALAPDGGERKGG